MTKEELQRLLRELATEIGDGALFEPQALQFLTVRGLKLEEARAALALGQESGLLERTPDSHFRRGPGADD